MPVGLPQGPATLQVYSGSGIPLPLVELCLGAGLFWLFGCAIFTCDGYDFARPCESGRVVLRRRSGARGVRGRRADLPPGQSLSGTYTLPSTT